MVVAYKAPGQLKVVRMRVNNLDTDGSLLTGDTDTYVSGALIQLTSNVDITAGATLSQANGAGIVCLTYRDLDQTNGLVLAAQLCTPDPVLTQMLVGGTLLLDGDDIVRGWSYPLLDGSDANLNGVSVEAWTYAITGGAQDADFPYYRYVWPRVKWTIGDKTLDNTPAINNVNGYAYENTNFGSGPATDIGSGLQSAAVGAYFLDDADLPDATTSGAETIPGFERAAKQPVEA